LGLSSFDTVIHNYRKSFYMSGVSIVTI